MSRSEFEFNDAQEIAALISIEGERVPLDRPVVTNSELTPGVEFWLVKTEEQMRMSLATIMHKSLQVRTITPNKGPYIQHCVEKFKCQYTWCSLSRWSCATV